MKGGKRYLPLMQVDGAWIERPDFFLFARMACEDREETDVVDQLYKFMLRADNTSSKLNSLEADLEKRHVRNGLQKRLFAGHVVLEMVRISLSTTTSPTSKAAIRLCAHNQYGHRRKSSPENLIREVERGFSAYRNTSHLQAALVLGDPRIDEIEANPEMTRRFLSRARVFEQFIDNNIGRSSLKWEPWRIPADIELEADINAKPLTDRELAIVRAT